MAEVDNIQIVSRVTEDKWPNPKDLPTGEEFTKDFSIRHITPKDSPTKISLVFNLVLEKIFTEIKHDNRVYKHIQTNKVFL
eukprot:12682829-Ditylum_brightwellii.AAC.1